MIFAPSTGTMWDPSVIWDGERFHLFAMHHTDIDVWNSRAMRYAVSNDGVHWDDRGSVIDDQPFLVWKMCVRRIGDRFIMNHGSSSGRPGHGNDTLRFWESVDLTSWTYLSQYDSHPDPRWYQQEERWDHMYVVPDDDGRGYLGFNVVRVKDDAGDRSCGLLRSDDGLDWTAMPPPVIDWGELPQLPVLEVGGCERIGDRYYLIAGAFDYHGNHGYSVYTFTSTSQTGPYTPDRDAFRLCGSSGFEGNAGVQWLANFTRGPDDTVLVTNYVTEPAAGRGPHQTLTYGLVWLLPMKQATVDEQGHLELRYWSGNDALKAVALPDPGSEACADAASRHPLRNGQASLIDDLCVHPLLVTPGDPERGAVIEGALRLEPDPAKPHRPSLAGFVIRHRDPGTDGDGTYIAFEAGPAAWRTSEIGVLHLGEEGQPARRDALDVTGPGCATVRGIDHTVSHRFRLLLRRRMFEVYLDDRLVQSFIVAGSASGRIDLMAQNGRCTAQVDGYWSMS